MRKLTSILGNSQRLDGGAMFGNAPKALWTRWVEADARNRIPLACRCMLVEDDGRTILFEAGIGVFFDPKLKDRFGVVESDHVLLNSLAAVDVSPEDVDVVVLSHLHFDHAGGLMTPYRDGEPFELVFPNASYVVGKTAWERATHPHYRDRASYVPELNALLEASGRLELVDGDTSATLDSDYRFHRSDGHTPGLLLAEVPMPDGPVVFVADLIPGAPWMHIPITMGYDRFPERLIDEKAALLSDLLARNGRVFFTHDSEVAMGRVARDDRGKFFAADTMVAPVRMER